MPAGNRVAVYDLVGSSTSILSLECRSDVIATCVSPCSSFLLAVDCGGAVYLVNLKLNRFLHRLPGGKVSVTWASISFSPDGGSFVVATDSDLRFWAMPLADRREFAPFSLKRHSVPHLQPITAMDWSPCGQHLLTASLDMTLRVLSVPGCEREQPGSLVGHSDAVVGGWFVKGSQLIVSVSKNGGLFLWKLQDQNSCQYVLYEKKYLPQVSVTAASYCRESSLVVICASSGAVSLFQIEEGSLVQIHAMTVNHCDAVAANTGGEWIAFASRATGSLIVWEWQSESLVLRQQGHLVGATTCVAASPDGGAIATGAADGSVRLWGASTGLCHAVLSSEHSGAVVAVKFAKGGSVLLSAGKSGIIQAFDVSRYRLFRTLVAPGSSVQFSSVACTEDNNESGDLVAASCGMGTEGDSEAAAGSSILLWSLSTGQLVDQLRGHTAPVTAVVFDCAPGSHLLGSCSWDGTLRLWDVYATADRQTQQWQHRSECLSLAFCATRREIAVTCTDGTIAVYCTLTFTQLRAISGRLDASVERTIQMPHFRCLAIAPDGGAMIAGGRSRLVCLYASATGVLQQRFALSRNRSLSEDEHRQRLPGVAAVEPVDCRSIAFSPCGRSFYVVVAGEGVQRWSLDSLRSKPRLEASDLEASVTPAAVRDLIRRRLWPEALCASLRLGESDLILEFLRHAPISSASVSLRALPKRRESLLLQFIGWLGSSTLQELQISSSVRLAWCAAALRVWNHEEGATPSAAALPHLRRCKRAVQDAWNQVALALRANLWQLKAIRLLSSPVEEQ